MTIRALTIFAGFSLIGLSLNVQTSGQIQHNLSDQSPRAGSLTPDTEPDTLVICPQSFQRALQPWLVHRRLQGHQIRVVTSRSTAYENRMMVKDIARSGSLKNLFIVGDSGDSNRSSSVQVPTDFVKARVNVQFGSDPEIATDNTYADTNDDGIPDLAVGRLPVDTPEQLTRQIKKIIDYEMSGNNSEWQRRINLVAGVGGFGQLIDKLIEQSTKQMVTDLVPPSYRTSMTYGSWTSPYCPDPRRFSQTAIERFNEGCLFWVYIGHGNRHRLDKIYLPDQAHRILDRSTCNLINSREGNPIAIFLACYTGAMDDQSDCLAEEMLLCNNGPVAVIAGTRVTMPYAMSLFSLEMLREFFDGDVETLGGLVRVAKQRMADNADDSDAYRSMIQGLGMAFSPKPKLLAQERIEHLNLMHLIGDPLLRLKRPRKLEISSPARANAGTPIPVTGHSHEDGVMTVEVAYRRDRFRHRPPHRREYDSSEESFQGYQTAYENARDLVCVRTKAAVKKGPFFIEVPLPDDANGECILTVFNSLENEIQIGSNPIFINAAERGSKSAAQPSRRLK